MAVFSKFPLIRLPQNEILRTIRVMDLENILSFSLISKRCKNLVKSIQIKGDAMCVTIRHDIVVAIKTRSKYMYLTYYVEPDLYWGMGAYGRKKKLTEPQTVLVEVMDYTDHSEDTGSVWENRDSTMKDWLEHLQNVFNCDKIDRVRFSETSFQFDIDDIKEVFGNKTGIYIDNTGCFAFNRSILQNFFPIEKLSILAKNFQDSKVPPNLLMQNRFTLTIRENSFPTNITLNDLLLINSKVISVENHRNKKMSPKHLNMFIKLWQKGSNPHMENLLVFYFNAEEDDKEIVMKGIKHNAAPGNRRRTFKSLGFTYPYTVTGGMDIYRMDGTKATIWIEKESTSAIVGMFVWFDHCVVES